MTISSWDFASFDGVTLKIHETGRGRAVLLLHGLFSNAETNWIKFGHADQLAQAGFRVIMPDLRAHGHSAAPQVPVAYPDDVLVKDVRALVAHLRLDAYDLGGFSLGARTTAKLLLTDAAPGKAILAGMGLDGLAGWHDRQKFFLEAIAKRETAKRGDPHWMAIQFMKSQKIDPIAATHLLKTFSDLEPEAIADIITPTLILCGSEDRDNGDPVALAEALPHAEHIAIPGTHLSSVTKKDLGAAMVAYLTA